MLFNRRACTIDVRVADKDEKTANTMPERPSRRQIDVEPDFGPRYRVSGTLGKGGMGEVYRAFDNELNCDVALKVVRGDGDLDGALARFRREIALARKVTSPHVLRVYDLDEHDGLRFLSMELVDGEDLAALMRREKRIPLARALAIFHQVAEGLAAAHAQGVVHRDLKPQNVLVGKDGSVRVADFGLARSIGESGMTVTGAILGSPAYMSPEQVKGEPTDERSDIYSLGVMLYQLVTGEPPFRGDTPHAVMEMRLHRRPKPVRDIAPEVAPHVQAVVERCLSLDVANRYQKVSELLADLDSGQVAAAAPSAPAPVRSRPRWVVPALVVAIAGVAGTIAWFARPRGDAPAASRATPAAPPVAASEPPLPDSPIDVLLFGIENRTTDPMFNGTLDVLLHSALRYSTLVDPSSHDEVKQLQQDLGSDGASDIAIAKRYSERARVRTLALHGKVVAKGAGFEISIAVDDARTGSRVFAATESPAKLDGVPPAIARLAVGLRTKLGERVPPDQADATGMSRSLDADYAYSLGIGLSNVDDAQAVVHFRRAIAIDPGFARAHVGAAIALWNMRWMVEANQEYRETLKHVDAMTERDRLAFLGDYYDTVTEEHERASASYEQLLAKFPTDRPAETNLPLTYQARGEVKKTLEAGARAAHDHPRDIVIRSNLVAFGVMAGDFDRAVTDGRQMLADFSRPLAQVHLYIATASIMLGHRDDALASLAAYAKLEPSAATAASADLAIAEGRLGDAEQLLTKGIADDVANKDGDHVEVKRAMLAELLLRRGDKTAARAMAALVVNAPPRVLEAALVELAAGEDKRPLATAARLADDPAPSRRAVAKLIQGESQRIHGKPELAMVAFQESIRIVDIPLAHFLLARAALDAKRFDDAYSELRTCIARRGEAVLGVDDVATYRTVTLFTYYLAKAQDGLGSTAAKDTYRAFLGMLHDADAADALIADARKHAM